MVVEADTVSMNSNDFPQALGASVEQGMSEETADEVRRLAVEQVQEHQTGRVLQHRFACDVTDHGARKAAVNRAHSKRCATSPPI